MPIRTIGAGSAAGGALELIFSETVGSGGATSLSTGTLPTGYKQLTIHLYGRSDGTYVVKADEVLIALNGDTTNGNYVQCANFFGDSDGNYLNTETRNVFSIPGHTADASFFASCIAQVTSPEGTDGYKSITSHFASHRDSTANRYGYNSAVTWKNTAAITSIALTLRTGDFVEGTTLLVTGVK